MAGIQGSGARGLATLALGIGLAVVRSQAHEASPMADVLPLDVADDGMLAVRSTIDGTGPFRLLLDTGANRSAVSTRVAASLGLVSVAKTVNVTATGRRLSAVVRLGSVAVGSVTKEGLFVGLLEDSEIKALGEVAGRAVDGILGQDFLLTETYTLDYQHQRLVWGGDPEAIRAPAARLLMRETEGRWLAAAPQNGRVHEIPWFVPDSGATTVVLFDRGRPSPIQLGGLTCCARMSTLVAGRFTDRALIERLTIGSIVIRAMPASVVARREPDAPEGDGLLPLALFRSATFEREGYLILQAR